jgi:hypothetical protein
MSRAVRDGAKGGREVRTALRGLASLAGLLGFSAFCLLRIGPAFDAAHQRLRNALKNARESEDAALARLRTPEYVAAIRKVREAIPENAAYYLVPADGGHGDYFVRFDLAPRRPILLDKLPAGPPPQDAPHCVVLARIDLPGPEVLSTAAYLRRGARP